MIYQVNKSENSNWLSIELQSNSIAVETEKAVLIRIPKTNKYFWHPKKLVRLFGKSNYMFSFSFTEEWKFKITEKSKSGKTVISNEEVDYETLVIRMSDESDFEDSDSGTEVAN